MNNSNKKGFFATIGSWFRRMFMGGSKELVDVFEVEKLESPSKMAVKTFFRRKLAVTALCILAALFLFVFIGPLFLPMNLSYTDDLQKNIGPNFSMLSVPSGLKNNIRSIDGFANFTVGVSEDNTLYMWGSAKDSLSKTDYSDFPEEIKPGQVLMASAGSDHVIAITTDRRIVGWGNNTRGQYGEAKEEDGLQSMAVVLAEFKKTDADGNVYYQIPEDREIQQLTCGYQTTALVIDGHLYMWGNLNACLNMKEVSNDEAYNTDVKKAVLSNYRVVVLKEDGTVTGGKNMFFRESAKNSAGEVIKNFRGEIDGSVVDIAATNNCYAFLTKDGEVYVNGASEYGEDAVAAIPAGEKLVSISGGTRHFAGLTDKGHAIAWGYSRDGQCDLGLVEGDTVYTGAKQTYVVNNEGELVKKAGLRGYIFGTDGSGRDIFARIMHGGKMTMTIGSVAVIISSVIAIIVGCLSGYFGGWVDMLLMRITEIVSSIPFLPFAMMLSYVIRTKPIGETMRIFIIMMILGMLSWTGLARMIRGQVLAEREKEFVTAAKSMGVKESRIAFKHILPNIISVILVSMTLDFATCLLTESSLSYLGFGVQQPQPTWGNMLNGANNSIVIQNYWWQWLFPAIFLSLATISINIIGDTLRDVLDPKSTRDK